MIGLTLSLATLFWSPPPPGASGQSDVHRVTLKSGTTLQGELVERTPEGVVIRLRFGDLSIERTLIKKIELVGDETLKDPEPTPKATEPPPELFRPLTPAATVPAIRVATRLELRVKRILDEARRALPEHQYDVMSRLRNMGPGTASALADQLNALGSGELLDYATSILSEMKDERCLLVLEKQSKDNSRKVRASVASILGRLGDLKGIRTLRKLLHDPEAEVRGAAAYSMGLVGDEFSYSALAPLCTDNDGDVRAKTVQALLTLSRRHDQQAQVARTFAAALVRARSESKVQLLNGLSLTGDPEVWHLVENELRNRSPLVRAEAARTLGRLKASESYSRIVDRLDRERAKAPLMELAKAAGALRLTDAIPALIDRLEDRDEDVRKASGKALRDITGRAYGDEFEPWERWYASLGRRN